MDVGADGGGDAGWEGVADLAVGVGFAACDVPVWGESLDACGHGDGESGHAGEAGFGWGVGEGFAVDAECGPGVAGAGGAEVGAAVFFGTTYEGGGDGVGVVGPGGGVFPTVFGHEVVEGFADGGCWVGVGGGPGEGGVEVAVEGDEDDAGA